MAYLTINRIGGDPDRLLDGYRRSSGLMDQVGHDHGLILHTAAQTAQGLLIVNLWPSEDGSQAAAADPRRLSVLRQEALVPEQQQKEHYEVERYVLFREARPTARAAGQVSKAAMRSRRAVAAE